MQLLQDTFIIENLQVLSEGSTKGPMRIKGVFGRCNEKNNNGRIYPTAVLESQLEKVQPLISERRLCGELDHPQNDTVKLSNASHLITKLEMKGDELIGEAEVLQTPAGLTAKALVEGGVKIGISSRGMGTLSEDHDGNKIVNEDFRLVTFDLVADPSTRGAFPGLSESTESQFVRDSQKKLTKESNFITMLEAKMKEAYKPWIEEDAKKGYPKKGIKGGTKEAKEEAEKREKNMQESAMEAIRKDGHWHRIAEMIADGLGHSKKKVNESFAANVADADKARRDRLAVTGHDPRSLTGAGWRARRNIRKTIRAQGSEDIRQSRLLQRAQAGGDVGLRARLASAAQKMSGGRMGDRTAAMLGGTKSAAYARETERIAQKGQAAAQQKSGTAAPTKHQVDQERQKQDAAKRKASATQAASSQQDVARGRAASRDAQLKAQDADLAAKKRQERQNKLTAMRANVAKTARKSKPAERRKPQETEDEYQFRMTGQTNSTSYKQIGSVLAEMFYLGEMKVTVKSKSGSTRPTAAIYKPGKIAIKTAETEHGQRQGTRQLKKAAEK